MIGVAAICGLTLIVCYAMRLRVEWLRDEWSKRLAAAHTKAAEADARAEQIKSAVETIRQNVVALQGARNAEVFSQQRRVG